MPIRNALASLAVKDLHTALQWYERLLRRAPDQTPMPSVAEWKFDGGGWLQIYELPERAGHGSVTLAVTDIDEQVAHVRSLGIATGERSDNDQVRTLMLTDPDGNHIAFAEAKGPGVAS